MTPDKPAATDDEDIFRRVSVERVSQLIVNQIKVLINDGRLHPGDRLPSERELCDQFGVSRVTVREALRVLEAGGLVEIRVGARGGAFVTRPTAEQLGEGLADLISLSPMTASDVTEARLVFELGMMPLAVERATAEDVEALLGNVEEGRRALKDGSYTMDISAAFHVQLAACTHNPAIDMLMRSFHGPLLMSLREAQVAEPLMGRRGTDEHRAIAKAIEARDTAEAEAVMRRHIGRTARRLGST